MELSAIYQLMLCCFMCGCDLQPHIRPSNGLSECRKNSALTALEVLPGGGWDNLRNIDMGRVMNLSYFQCQTTEDGVYLIPDEVFVIPQKESGVATHSEMIMSWLQHVSTTSRSINTDTSRLPEINGKFSEENQRTKTHQVIENSVTFQIQVRNHLYTVKAYPNFAIDSHFVHQVEDIVDAIESNQTCLAKGITLQKWQESTLNNLVAIDRAGLPLHYFLNSLTFPNFPEATLTKLALLVYEAADRYYEVNTIPGCVNPDSKNFNFQANVDDASCKGPVTNLTFGGIYQTCNPLTSDGNDICDELAQKNPATGDYSCPRLYTASLLRSEIVERSYNKYVCCKRCHSCGFLWRSTCCDQVCGDVVYVRRAKINTTWCSTTQKTPEYSGYLFGGLFGPSMQNPFTKSKSCPPNFFAQKFLSKGMKVCLSNDYETGTRFSVPFGGFFSCQSGNPLANGQSRCPPQFSQQVAAISDGCQVLLCIQSGVFTGGQLKPVRLPPFTRPPLINMIATKTVAVMTEGNRSWVRVGGTRTWQLAKPGEINEMALMLDRSSQMSGGEKAGVAVSVTALIALVVTGTVF